MSVFWVVLGDMLYSLFYSNAILPQMPVSSSQLCNVDIYFLFVSVCLLHFDKKALTEVEGVSLNS